MPAGFAERSRCLEQTFEDLDAFLRQQEHIGAHQCIVPVIEEFGLEGLGFGILAPQAPRGHP